MKTINEMEKKVLDGIALRLDKKEINKKTILNALKEEQSFLVELNKGETDKAKKAKRILTKNVFSMANVI